jgi:flagellar basal-body rod modification protein FlgD
VTQVNWTRLKGNGKMTISSINDTTSATSTNNPTGSTSGLSNLTANDFMTLLLTQLKNQDPTNPTDMAAFTSQLCSLNQLEQLTTANSYLKELASNDGTQAVNYIGKTVTVDGDTLSVSKGTADNLVFNLESDASSATITIYDSEGNEVRTISASDLSSGTNSIKWDGTDDDGNTVDDGEYTYEVSAADSSGDSVTATTYKTATVTGVVYEDGSPYLLADGEEISLDDITGVYQS